MNNHLRAKYVAIGAVMLLPLFTALPAEARSRSAEIARDINHALYVVSGSRVCGSTCGKAAGKLGDAAFDTGEKFGKWYGEQTAKAGRAIGQKLRK